ncbi:YaiO family outer membrane beta-barrel protein [Polaribacter sp. Z022]|uniref:YaiO family outer membrane beta-barrel protein n=1 Tax=Polaribacter sp. Z022 TaxID=2927125 RepID=UPI00202126C4|nr:YaiO family outer membrane beta-barrel protein [Polaribacter sp. Z022]MCL7753504.1 YaiO family outer membrane beta-barrel protein [Polaribacter sp. Z022]
MIKKRILVCKILMLILFCNYQLEAQEKVFNGDPDESFKIARDLAFNGKRKQAQDSLRLILTKYPNYLDIRAFLASTYSWDGNYAQAREEFSRVLKRDKKRKNTWVAAINNELWADKPFKALELSKQAIISFPKDEDLIQLKAKSEFNSGDTEEAFVTINSVLELNPDNKKAIDYKESITNLLRNNAIGVSYSVDIYKNNDRDPMHYATINYSRSTKYGSITAKLNYSNRFSTDNYQYELDLYPRIVEGMYAYLSAGFSNSPLNPSVRYGAELYKSLPKSFEASLGIRGLKFSTTTLIYTGSVGWYTGNSYWVFRTYVTPNDAGSSKSGSIEYRKYGSDADNYFRVSAGFGISPELDRFVTNVGQDEIFQLDSQKINLGYYFSSKSKINAWGFSANFYREEKPFSPGDYFLYTSLGVSYRVRFK